MTKGWIWFDMDGTIADFYGVNNWLECLMQKDPTPYRIAKSLYNITDLLETLIELKENGYNLGIISWLAKNPNVGFDKKVIKAKMDWLDDNCISDLLDEIIITNYGRNKADTCRKYGKGILVDDEKPNRDNWDLGATIDANENILKILNNLLDN